MSNQAKCALCGEPMPPGEEMFKFHGYSGPCPKSPLPAAPVGEPAAMPPEIQMGDRVKATNYKDAVLIDRAHIAAWFNERPFLVESVERCIWRRPDRKEPTA